MKESGMGEQKTPRTGYCGGEDWEGGGPPYKPIHIHTVFVDEQILPTSFSYEHSSYLKHAAYKGTGVLTIYNAEVKKL
jgi:hypothetical protein